jgi:hypothetical protein
MSLPNRLAEEGDHLVVHQFPTGTLGLITAPKELAIPVEPVARSWWWKLIEWLRQVDDSNLCAVCIPPGARLMLHDISDRIQRDCHVSPVEVVTFTQLGADPHRHRDAVRFSNGRELLLQKLTPGQRAHVLSLTLPEDREPVPDWSDAVRGHATIS